MRTVDLKCKRWDFCREPFRGRTPREGPRVAKPRGAGTVSPMPELPEVEVLCRRLAPRLAGRILQRVEIHRPASIHRSSTRTFTGHCIGRVFGPVSRRAKRLLFGLKSDGGLPDGFLQIHLGMTGRVAVVDSDQESPSYPAVTFHLDQGRLVFSDARGLGRVDRVWAMPEGQGPEPLDPEFTPGRLTTALGNSSQPIKVRLMDPRCLAGIGNIYAAECLFEAGIHPKRPTRDLREAEVRRLHRAIRSVLSEAIDVGWAATRSRDPAKWTLFHRETGGLGSDGKGAGFRVYDREGAPCPRCGLPIQRIRQAARSTYLCPGCQPLKP